MRRIIRGIPLKSAISEANRLSLQTDTVYSVHKARKAYDVFIGMAEFGEGTATYTARPAALRAAA